MRDEGDGGCLACGGALRPGPGHGWLRCSGCRSWRRQRLPSPTELHEIHERLYFSDGDDVHDMTADRLLEQYVGALDTRVGLAGTRVLDVGAGTAPTGELVAARGGDYRAVEASETARLALADRGWRAYATPAEAGAEAPFDAALLVEIVEHLLEPAAFLREVGARLRPGGHLYLTTPNARSLHGRLKGGRWWAAALEAHVALYSVQGLDALFAASGLRRVARHRRIDYGKGGWHAAAQSVLQVVGGDGGLRVLARSTPDRPDAAQR